MWEPRKPVIRLWTSITLAAPKRARREKSLKVDTLTEDAMQQAGSPQDALPKVSRPRGGLPLVYPGRIPVLDELRGIAILLLLLDHRLFSIHFESTPLVRLTPYAHLAFRNGSLAALVPMPCRADAFCLGVLCALAFRTPALWQRVNARRAVILWATGGMATLLLWLAYGWPTTLGLSRAQCSPAATPWSHVSTRAAW